MSCRQTVENISALKLLYPDPLLLVQRDLHLCAYNVVGLVSSSFCMAIESGIIMHEQIERAIQSFLSFLSFFNFFFETATSRHDNPGWSNKYARLETCGLNITLYRLLENRFLFWETNHFFALSPVFLSNYIPRKKKKKGRKRVMQDNFPWGAAALGVALASFGCIAFILYFIGWDEVKVANEKRLMRNRVCK